MDASGSPTKVLQAYVAQAVSHILLTFRPQDDEAPPEEDAPAEDVFDQVSAIRGRIAKRHNPPPLGFEEVEEGCIETITAFIIHQMAKIADEAQSIASARNHTVNVIDILQALYAIDQEGASNLAAASRGSDGKMNYLTHLKATPSPAEVDTRLEHYKDRVLLTASPRLSPSSFPGPITHAGGGPQSLFGTILRDAGLRFFYTLCLDVIRSIIGSSASQARKFHAAPTGEELAEDLHNEWGLEDELVDKASEEVRVSMDANTLEAMLNAICGSEEALQNLISHEVCQVMPHSRLQPPDYQTLVDPVETFTKDFDFLSPHMAAMIRAMCYRAFIQAWPLLTRTVYEHLNTERLASGVIPYPIKRILAEDETAILSATSFVPFVQRLNMQHCIEQPEPGGSVLGQLVMQATPGTDVELIVPYQGDQLEASASIAGPAHMPLFAPKMPTGDTYHLRLLSSGFPAYRAALAKSWEAYCVDNSRLR